jgi:Protein of unknown function (DUF3300)
MSGRGRHHAAINAAPSEQQLLKPAELEGLVAPIALYPDALLANVLMAATWRQCSTRAPRLAAGDSAAAAEDSGVVVVVSEAVEAAVVGVDRT